jgi:hypothetical protein
MKSFVEMHHRPFRPPRHGRHVHDPDLVCMEWQSGTGLHQLEIIEVTWARAVFTHPYTRHKFTWTV